MGQRGGGQAAAAVAASVGPVPQRKRRAHAYAVFSSEMRRSLGIMGGQSDVPINEVTRIVAEKWRDLDATSRRKYEDRANMINAQVKKNAPWKSCTLDVAHICVILTVYHSLTL